MSAQHSRVLGTPRRRRLPMVVIAALLLLAAVATSVWAAWGVSLPDGLFALVGVEETPTPTRTPRPITFTPTPVPVELAILLPSATPTITPSPIPPATELPPEVTPQPLPDWLAGVVQQYGMDPTRKFVVVDLAAQRMTVWDPAQPLREMPVSTGDESRGYRTLAWYGLVGEYWGTFNSFGVYADEGWYLFEDAGSILIHGAPYRLVDGQKVYEDMDALGAYPASRGCIRLAPDDANWFSQWGPQGVPIVILPKDQGAGAN